MRPSQPPHKLLGAVRKQERACRCVCLQQGSQARGACRCVCLQQGWTLAWLMMGPMSRVSGKANLSDTFTRSMRCGAKQEKGGQNVWVFAIAQ